jgi:NhaC family Na+:H+ antiporter
LITFLTLGALTTDIGRELLVVVLLASAAVAAVVAARVGCSWDDVQRATGRKLADVLPALLILLGIGMLIGTWVFSGTIPALVAVGLDLVHPRYLALTAFLGTAVMSTATGTSWGSAGTLGVALVGMAGAMGASLPMVAGAVVSGEDSVTLTEPLMPWTVSAVFMATTLGVSTVDYLPWAIFCLTGPLFSLFLAGDV